MKYNVEDSKGNKAEEEIRTVFVTPDKTRPVISLTGDDPQIIAVYHSYFEQGAIVSDNIDGDVSENLMIQHHIDTSKVDTYYVRYTAYDFTGNYADAVEREVYVVDTVAPVITLIGSDTLDIPLGGTVNDPGATVTDNYYEDIQIQTYTNVDVNSHGWYWIRYDAKDGSGNDAVTVVRTLKVGDPTISVKDISSNEQFNIYPNPTTGLFTFTIKLSQEQEINILVIDALGKIVKEIHPGIIKTNNIEIDFSDNPEGIYFLQTFLKDKVLLHKVTLVK